MNGKILIVDDEKPIADILKYNLEEEGYQVHWLPMMESKRCAWLFKNSRILFLLDIMLPLIDGFSVCKNTSKIERSDYYANSQGGEVDKVWDWSSVRMIMLPNPLA